MRQPISSYRFYPAERNAIEEIMAKRKWTAVQVLREALKLLAQRELNGKKGRA